MLVLKGEAWYLRKQIEGKRTDHALKICGGEKNRKRAEKAATALERTLLEGRAAIDVLSKLGLQPAAPKARRADPGRMGCAIRDVVNPNARTRTNDDRVAIGGRINGPFTTTPSFERNAVDCGMSILLTVLILAVAL